MINDDLPKTADALQQRRLIEHEAFIREHVRKRRKALRKIERRLADAWKHARIIQDPETRVTFQSRIEDAYDALDEVTLTDLEPDIDPDDLYATLGTIVGNANDDDGPTPPWTNDDGGGDDA